jgi:hypothetical protein
MMMQQPFPMMMQQMIHQPMMLPMMMHQPMMMYHPSEYMSYPTEYDDEFIEYDVQYQQPHEVIPQLNPNAAPFQPVAAADDEPAETDADSGGPRGGDDEREVAGSPVAPVAAPLAVPLKKLKKSKKGKANPKKPKKKEPKKKVEVVKKSEAKPAKLMPLCPPEVYLDESSVRIEKYRGVRSQSRYKLMYRLNMLQQHFVSLCDLISSQGSQGRVPKMMAEEYKSMMLLMRMHWITLLHSTDTLGGWVFHCAISSLKHHVVAMYAIMQKHDADEVSIPRAIAARIISCIMTIGDTVAEIIDQQMDVTDTIKTLESRMNMCVSCVQTSTACSSKLFCCHTENAEVSKMLRRPMTDVFGVPARAKDQSSSSSSM